VLLTRPVWGRGLWAAGLALLATVLSLSLFAGVAQATTRVVTSPADTGPGSLRAVITQSSAGDIVQLPARADHYLVSSEIPITVPLTIQGAGVSSSVVDAGGHSRVFHITSAVPTASTVTLQGLTVTGGNTTALPGGGGILDDSGALTLIDGAVTANTATVDLGSGRAAGGGGIYNAGGLTTLTRSAVTGNHADVTSAPAVSGAICCNGGGGLYQQQGSITADGSTLSNNTAVIHGSDTGTGKDSCCGGGGAIYENDSAAVITIAGSTLDSNTATILGGECCHGGGAIYFDANSSLSTQDLIISSSHLDHNTTTVTTQTIGQGCCSGGGAIATFGGLDASNSTFNFNTASLTNQSCCNGGGALNFDTSAAQISLDRSDVSGNAFRITTAGGAANSNSVCCNGGGAVQLDTGNALFSVTGSLISGNSAQLSGVSESGGGAIYEDTSSGYKANYANSTLANNTTDAVSTAGTPPQGGGAIYNFGSGNAQQHSTDTFANSTIAGNSAPAGTAGGVLALAGENHSVNSIIAGNHSAGEPNCAALPPAPSGSPGTFSSGGHNIESTNSCGLGAAGDLVNTDPRLGPLQLNGGPLSTMALLDGSPAINSADNAACPATDMRGIARPQPAGGTCDIGSYEATAPNASTGPATFVTSNRATLNGTVNPQNLTTSVHFDYGRTAAYGSSTPAQTLAGGYGDRPLGATLTNLTKLTGYHYRIVATSVLGTAIGADAVFKTTAGPGRIALFGHLGFVSPRGVAGIFVGCFGNPCVGKLTITSAGKTIAARRTFTVAGNDGGIVHVRLDRSGRSALAAARHQHLPVTVAVSDSSGHAASASFTLVRFSTAAVAGAARAGAAAYGHTGFVSSGGAAGVFVGCFATTTCTGTVTLSGGEAAASYRLRPGTGTLIVVKLTNATVKELQRRGKIDARLTLSDTTTHVRQHRTISLVTYQ
jgi:hypothetical protein